MTIPSDDAATGSSGTSPAVSPSADWVLQEMVELANKIDGFQMSVTLIVAGAVVTGMLIGAKEYYTQYGGQWRIGLGSDTDAGRAVEERWRKFGEDTAALFAQDDEQQTTEPLPPPQYIHLKQVRIALGSNLIPRDDGLLWRGRLAEVAGFSVGMLSTSPA